MTKALFGEIRRGDLAAVSARLDANPALANAVASAPPKKDDGALDTAGNPALGRALLDARQVVDEPLLDDLVEDLGRVFGLLLGAGADVHHVHPVTGRTLLEAFGAEPVGRFLWPEP